MSAKMKNYFEKELGKIDNKIESINEKLIKGKLTTAKFLQLCDERASLIIKQRNVLKKIENINKGITPNGYAEIQIF